jgi:hypothetical protein
MEILVKYPVALNQENILLHQEHMWNLGRPTPPFHLPSVLILEGPLNVAALEQALNSVIQRHAGLHSAFVRTDKLSPLEREMKISELAKANACATGMYAQCLVDSAILQLQMHFIAYLDPEEQEIEIENILINSCRKPFLFSQPPFIKAHLFNMSHDRHLMVLLVHHLICDLYSLFVLKRDLAFFYSSIVSNGTPHLPTIKRNFMDFALDQYERATSNGYDQMLDYWDNQMTQYLPARLTWEDLPSSFKAVADDSTGSEIGYEELALPHDLMDAWNDLIKKRKITLYMLYIAACMIMFKKLINNNAGAVWSIFANKTHLDYLNAIGNFANLHFLGADFSDRSTVSDILDSVRTTVLNAIANQSAPFNLVMGRGNPAPNAGGIFIVCDMVQINNIEASYYQSCNISIQHAPVPEYLMSIGENMLAIRLWHYSQGGLLTISFSKKRLTLNGAISMLAEIKNIITWCVSNENESVAKYKLSFK